jgi:cytochrome c6
LRNSFLSKRKEIRMKRFFVFLVFLVIAVFVLAGAGVTKAEEEISGAELFKDNCAPCHPDGGNVYNPQKTLLKKDLEANNIKKRSDIINKMRNPGPGMMKFDEDTIPYKDAKKIAEYILKTFN